ncbi:MAG: glycosyltransferase family 39 protein [Pirellulaceae bacterium]|nr:glycosyltransferase family 39 protein [Pirellulaceae bacterium]
MRQSWQIRAYAKLAIAALFIALGVSSARLGLDGERYLNWATVANEGDIRHLGDPELLSPQGVPFYQWSAGPGLAIAPLVWPLQLVTDDSEAPLLVGGLACAGVFWLCVYASLREFLGHREALMGLLLAFIATPLGYYSRSIASETISLLPAGILLWQGTRIAKGNSPNWLLIGVAAGLLLLVRSFLAAYAWPVMAAGAWVTWRNGRPLAAMVAFVPWIAVALWQVGSVHFWMTGSWLKSPYGFGDGEFRSLDPACPHLVNILLDPFHGLIATHPLVGLGLIALPICTARAMRRGDWPLVLLWGGAMLAVGVNIYAQGCWYYWCGLGFGMRGLVLVSIPAVLALLVLLRDWRDLPWPRSALVALGGLCALYSFLHAMQGPTHYLTWSRLFEGQVCQLLDLVTDYHLPIGVVGGLIAAGLVMPRRAEDWLLIALLPLVGLYLFDRSVGGLALLFVVIFAPLVAIWRLGISPASLASATQWMGCVAFVSAIVCFVPLSWRVQQVLKPTPVPQVVFQEGDVLAAYRFIAWQRQRADFAAEADKLRQFLIRQRGDAGVAEIEADLPPEFTYELGKQWRKRKRNSRYD